MRETLDQAIEWQGDGETIECEASGEKQDEDKEDTEWTIKKRKVRKEGNRNARM